MPRNFSVLAIALFSSTRFLLGALLDRNGHGHVHARWEGLSRHYATAFYRSL